MPDNDTSHNTEPLDDGTGLRGGLEGGGGPMPIPNPGGTNPIMPAGDTHGRREPGSGGNRNDSWNDAEALYKGSRHISQAEAKQRARDEADVDTNPGTPNATGGPERVHQIHPNEPGQPSGSKGDAPH